MVFFSVALVSKAKVSRLFLKTRIESGTREFKKNIKFCSRIIIMEMMFGYVVDDDDDVDDK